ncbi:MAG: TRZ/ATZ family hydrolase [Pseudomonadales bacterium]|nr:TRZ/ATZ family hydrolase [Pseudomonadales bacterium]MBL6804186.1 TRZ/ATZ family hydrolase [Pseudomonadales bacterium]
MTDKPKITPDLVVFARWIVPVIPNETIFENSALFVTKGRISHLVPASEAETMLSDNALHAATRLENHALIPGLINAHGHAAMTLLRGVGDDMPLQAWLEQRIWPLEGELADAEFVNAGVRLAAAEMIRSGTTCFADNYFYPDESAKVTLETKLRVQLACPVLDFPTRWAKNADEYINKTTALHDRYRDSERVHVAFGPHSPYSVSDEPLRKIAKLAAELDLPIHMHVHETQAEVDDAQRRDGIRPLARLHALGLLTPRLICTHMTALTQNEIELMAESGSHVAHCPESNLKLASGFCEVEKLTRHGINVALGTDGCASNNDLDMFSEMRTAAQLGKAVAKDATAVPASAALAMATINGAKAMGLDGEIGSLEIGKLADLCAVDMSGINSMPLYDVVSQLIYSTQASQVSHVWSSGEPLLYNGKLQTIDEQKLKQTTQEWQLRVKQTADMA